MTVRFRGILILFLTGCMAMLVDVKPEMKEEEMSIRYLALGDSYTIGESVAENERWPNQLADSLSKGGISFDLTLIARTGWTTAELWQGIQAVRPKPPYDLVSLMIGVNNQYRGYAIQEYRKEFTLLLNKSIEYAGGNPDRVFILSIPDWSATPFASGRDLDKISTEIDAFNRVNREESEKAAAHYVDITSISREARDDPSLIAVDGLHPSGKMYRLWVEQLAGDVVRVLK